MEKKPRRCGESSTTSSCTSVAVCNNSTSAAARYVLSLIGPCSLALSKTNIGLSCLPLRFMMYFIIVSSKSVSLFTASANFFSKILSSSPMMSLMKCILIIQAIYHSVSACQSNLFISFAL